MLRDVWVEGIWKREREGEAVDGVAEVGFVGYLELCISGVLNGRLNELLRWSRRENVMMCSSRYPVLSPSKYFYVLRFVVLLFPDGCSHVSQTVFR